MTYKEQYNKLRKNIQRQINYYKKQGFEVTTEIPAIPKKITKGSVNRLLKYKSNLKKQEFLDVETGQVASLYKLKKEKKEDLRKAEKVFWGGEEAKKESTSDAEFSTYMNIPFDDFVQFSDMVIAEYRRQISRFPKKVAEIVLTKLDEAIKKSGKDNVAYRLQYNNESLSEYLNNVGLFGDSIQAILEYCDAMFGDLPGMDKEARLQISDIMDSEAYNE